MNLMEKERISLPLLMNAKADIGVWVAPRFLEV